MANAVVAATKTPAASLSPNVPCRKMAVVSVDAGRRSDRVDRVGARRIPTGAREYRVTATDCAAK
jgi:hypothetical protein